MTLTKERVREAMFAKIPFIGTGYTLNALTDAAWPLIERALSEARREGAREGLTRLEERMRHGQDGTPPNIPWYYHAVAGFRDREYPAPRAPETVTWTCLRCGQADERVTYTFPANHPQHATEADCIRALGTSLFAARSQGAR